MEKTRTTSEEAIIEEAALDALQINGFIPELANGVMVQTSLNQAIAFVPGTKLDYIKNENYKVVSFVICDRNTTSQHLIEEKCFNYMIKEWIKKNKETKRIIRHNKKYQKNQIIELKKEIQNLLNEVMVDKTQPNLDEAILSKAQKKYDYLHNLVRNDPRGEIGIAYLEGQLSSLQLLNRAERDEK